MIFAQIIEENRYPFDHIFDFILGGYFRQIEAFPLLLGLIFLVISTISIFFSKRPVGEKFVYIYFSTAIYTNFAYKFGSISWNELFGSIGVFFILINFLTGIRAKTCKASFMLLVIYFLILFHAVLIIFIYPELTPTSDYSFLRGALISKIFVLAIMCYGAHVHLGTRKKIENLIKYVLTFAIVGMFIYWLQFIMYRLLGIMPYGTYADAGFTGHVGFGGCSIERGHFGKFITPLFPFFLYAALCFKRGWIMFAVFTVTTLINWSASSYAFFFIYSLLALLLFSGKIIQKPKFLISLLGLLIICSIIFWIYSEAAWGVYEKIIGATDEVLGNSEYGSESYGRSLESVWQYLQQYPLGVSYGGSTLRSVGDLYTDLGIGAFFAQLSFVGVFVIIIFLYGNMRIYWTAKSFLPLDIRKIFVIAILGSWFVYSVDILWFLPHIWLQLVICENLGISFKEISRRVLKIEEYSSINIR